MPFSFSSVAIFGRFNEIHVFNFSGRFRTPGEIISGSNRCKKISRIFEKNQVNISRGTIFMTKTEKTLYHYIGFPLKAVNFSTDQ